MLEAGLYVVSPCPFVLCALCSQVLPRCSQATLQLPLRPLELQLAAAPRIGCPRSAAGRVALQSAVQMRGDLQRERVRCRGVQGYCKQVAEESAKVVPSCSSVVCADAAAASRVAVIVSLVLLQAIAAESCSCYSALTTACVR